MELIEKNENDEFRLKIKSFDNDFEIKIKNNLSIRNIKEKIEAVS
jgi:hypothetical protein